MSEPQLHSFNTSRRPHTVPKTSGADDTHDEDQTIVEAETEAQDVEIQDADINPPDEPEQEPEQDEGDDETMENEDEETPSLPPTQEIRPDDNADEVEQEEHEEEEDQAGATALQLSKIKKIFKTDPEHISASEAAVFSTAVATELFIQYFTEQAALVARTEKRKKIQYKDFSTAVSNNESLAFLNDLVPKTHALQKLVDEDRVRLAKKDNGETPALAKGQKVLNFTKKDIATGTDSESGTREGTVDVEETPAPATEETSAPEAQAEDEDVVMLD